VKVVDCQSIVTLLSAELDGALSADESQAVRTHLLSCADCAKRFALLNDTRQAYRASMHEPRARRGSATAAALLAAIIAAIVVGIVVIRTPDQSSRPLGDTSTAVHCGITDSASCFVEVPPCGGAECALLVPQ
jgi:predicted anti-sigma-YlaC factor YlaD